MKSPDLWQVRLPPDDGHNDWLEEAKEVSGEYPKITGATWLRCLIAPYVHKIGIHHYVQFRTFDPQIKRIMHWPGYWVCATCPKGVIER